MGIVRFRMVNPIRALHARVGRVVLTRGSQNVCLVIGEAPEASALGMKLLASGTRVVLVGHATPPSTTARTRARLTVHARAGEDLLSRLLNVADHVVVCGASDSDALRLARDTSRLSGTAPFPTIALLDTDEAADAWRRDGGSAATRTSLHVGKALRVVPPWLHDRATPPPVVIGQGPTASELVRQIAIGWQQPGAVRHIAVITSDRSWADATAARLATDHPSVANVLIDETPPRVNDVESCVDHRVRAWRAPSPRHATVTGPTLYVVDDLDLATRLASMRPDARVCALTERAPQALPGGLTVIARQDVLSDPSTVLATQQGRLEEVIFAEVASWPTDIPSLLGDLARRLPEQSGREPLPLTAQPPAVRARVRAVATMAPELMRGLGISLDAGAPSERIILGPHELRLLRDALADRVSPTLRATPVEHAQRALELATQLPVLLARSGRTLRRPVEHRDLLTAEHIADLAEHVHATYVLTARALGNATGSQVAHMGWGEVDDFTRESNRAQVADIAAKLVSLGLTWQRADPPVIHHFTDLQVEALARLEHRRWEQFERRNGRADHELAKPWPSLSPKEQEYDRRAVLALPEILASIGLEIIDLERP